MSLGSGAACAVLDAAPAQNVLQRAKPGEAALKQVKPHKSGKPQKLSEDKLPIFTPEGSAAKEDAETFKTPFSTIHNKASLPARRYCSPSTAVSCGASEGLTVR